MTDSEYRTKRFDVYGACYIYSTFYHDGQFSRGYRLGCCIERKDYRPGLSIQRGECESEEMEEFLNTLIERRY